MCFSFVADPDKTCCLNLCIEFVKWSTFSGSQVALLSCVYEFVKKIREYIQLLQPYERANYRINRGVNYSKKSVRDFFDFLITDRFLMSFY